MRKFAVKILSLIIAVVVLCSGLAGCFLLNNNENNGNNDNNQDNENNQNGKDELPELAAPVVVIGADGVAVWKKSDFALYYVYVIDDGGEILTDVCSVRLNENQSIKVKIISANDGYADSAFSQPVTYIKGSTEEEGHAETDLNSDGLCDICGKSVTVELSLYAVNDLHGKFIDTATQPGVDEFTSYMKALYADNSREEILLSSGDMWQGTVESSTNRGQLITEWMNDVGFASMTLGNHEYDWGSQVIKPNSELAQFPFLAINITYNGRAVDYCRGSVVVEKGGLKVGIIGAIGNCLSSISGDYTAGLKFATGSALTSLVKNEADRLRSEEDCDFIVYSIHDGYGSSFSASSINSVTQNDISSYYSTELSDGYVDLVFEAHTHQSYILQDEYGVYHLQGGGENNFISCAEVTFNTANKEYKVKPRLISNSVYADSSIADDPAVNEIFEKYFPTDNPYTTVLGYNNSRKYSEAICEQLAELYYDAGYENWGASYKIALGGGYLKTRTPYSLEKGDVTYADLFSLLPFDNDIVLGRISGSDLKTRFLNSDNSNYHIYTTIKASEVSDNEYYYIIVDSYTSSYGYNRITEVARLSGGKYARDLLADFISEGGWDYP